MAEKRLVLGGEIGADQQLGEICIFELYPPFARIAVKRLALYIADHGR
jgi:hypothetical protein